ncbi:GNAT family N-acetyltransferase [Alteromonas facilis]|uniref:GNAT family N-acetyltransferase n=1 Tax=Alteromonas facilis TaxID=2048004 RepID=UPI000C292ADF|nr:GNAT family N-acetyltransferase [Alteromonas facilis]
MIPSLETARLKLIPPEVNCFDMYERFYTDEDASKMYGGPISKEQAWARLKADLGSWHLLGFGIWVIQSKSDNRYIGTCGFWQGHEWPKELTWWIIPSERGKGIATEASIAAVAHAHEVFQWDIVETYMNDENVAARGLVEKLGGIKVRRQTFNDGLSRDIYQLPNPSM